MAGFLVGDRPSYTPTVDTFNGTGAQTAFTLTQETTTDAAIVFISGVGQLPTGAYSISGTTLTFTSAPPSGTSNIWVTYNQPTGTTAIPSDGSISTAKLADLSVSTAKLQAGAVTAAKIETAPAIAVDNMTGILPALDGSALTGLSSHVELISHTTISSDTTISFTGLDSHTDAAMFEVDFIAHPSVNNVDMDLIIGTGATPTYQTSNYNWRGYGMTNAAGGNRAIGSDSQASMVIGEVQSTNYLGTDAGEGIQGRIWYMPHQGDNSYSRFWWTGTMLGSDAYNVVAFSGAGSWNQTTDVTAIQFGLTGAGNFVSGYFSLRKYKNA